MGMPVPVWPQHGVWDTIGPADSRFVTWDSGRPFCRLCGDWAIPQHLVSNPHVLGREFVECRDRYVLSGFAGLPEWAPWWGLDIPFANRAAEVRVELPRAAPKPANKAGVPGVSSCDVPGTADEEYVSRHARSASPRPSVPATFSAQTSALCLSDATIFAELLRRKELAQRIIAELKRRWRIVPRK